MTGPEHREEHLPPKRIARTVLVVYGKNKSESGLGSYGIAWKSHENRMKLHEIVSRGAHKRFVN